MATSDNNDKAIGELNRMKVICDYDLPAGTVELRTAIGSVRIINVVSDQTEMLVGDEAQLMEARAKHEEWHRHPLDRTPRLIEEAYQHMAGYAMSLRRSLNEAREMLGAKKLPTAGEVEYKDTPKAKTDPTKREVRQHVYRGVWYATWSFESDMWLWQTGDEVQQTAPSSDAAVEAAKAHIDKLQDGQPAYVDIVFDGPPGPMSGRFVEVETPDGQSVNFGEWVQRSPDTWALRVGMFGCSLKGNIK